MSEQPLTSQADTVIVVGKSVGAINEQLAQYNLAVGADVIHKVTTRADLNTAMALPVDTPWCVIDDISRLFYTELISRFGQPRTMAACLAMLNNEYAIHPSKLRG
jgi:hypothetical protein